MIGRRRLMTFITFNGQERFIYKTPKTERLTSFASLYDARRICRANFIIGCILLPNRHQFQAMRRCAIASKLSAQRETLP